MICKGFILLVFLVVIIYSKLAQVVQLFRHGARYHTNSFYDGNQTKDLWGELTSVGMRQHQNLGRMIRKEYIETLNLLHSTYTQGQIEVYSTDVNRTIESARGLLYGLYPLGQGQKLQKVQASYYLPPYSPNKTNSQQQTFALPLGLLPIPIRLNSSIILFKCQNGDIQIKKNMESQQLIYEEMNIVYKPFLRRMALLFNVTGQDFNISKMVGLYSTLLVDKYLGRKLPQALADQDYLNLQHLHQWDLLMKYNFNFAKAINSGKLSKLIADFDDRINDKNKKMKFTFISGHDVDLVPLFNTLNISSAQCLQELYRKGKTQSLNCELTSSFASSLIFELHSDNERDYYIKIKHDGIYMFLCEKKSTTCNYTEWKQIVKKSLVNPDDICLLKN